MKFFLTILLTLVIQLFISSSLWAQINQEIQTYHGYSLGHEYSESANQYLDYRFEQLKIQLWIDGVIPDTSSIELLEEQSSLIPEELYIPLYEIRTFQT